MTTFNQEGQTIHGDQTNIGGNIGQLNVRGLNDLAAILAELERLTAELTSAAQRGQIDPDLATEADYQMTAAADEMRRSNPDNGRFFDHLTRAQDLLKTAASAAGLVDALAKVAEGIRGIL